jgi:hypothetical protein
VPELAVGFVGRQNVEQVGKLGPVAHDLVRHLVLQPLTDEQAVIGMGFAWTSARAGTSEGLVESDGG